MWLSSLPGLGAGVDEFGSVGVAQLVDVDLDAGLRAVALPAVVGGVYRDELTAAAAR